MANQTIAKAIELDTALEIAPTSNVTGIASALQAARSSTSLFRFYRALTGVHDGINALTKRNVKVGFSHFDATVVDLTAADLAPIVAVCRERNVATFNALQPNLRKSMGMYLRHPNSAQAPTYTLVGGLAPAPRVG